MGNSNELFPIPNLDTSYGEIDSTYHCYTKADVSCTFAGNIIFGGNGLYTLAPQNGTSNTSQLASVGWHNAATPYYYNEYVPATSYRYGTVRIGPNSREYSVGVFYRCAVKADVPGSFPMAVNCTKANLYWVQVDTNKCIGGNVLLYGGGNNNVLCYYGADGNPPYGSENMSAL
jgi:hypothetical protein